MQITSKSTRKKKFGVGVSLVCLLYIAAAAGLVSNGAMLWKILRKVYDPYDGPTPPLTLLTGFSSNHMMEAMGMLQNLIRVGYKGPLIVYLMRKKSEPNFGDDEKKLRKELKKSKLNVTVYEWPEKEHFKTYCWKPKIVEHFFENHPGLSPVFGWFDSSARFTENPEEWAKLMVRDRIDFAGHTSIMGMGENTHADTWKYFDQDVEDFKEHWEIWAGGWLFNLYSNPKARKEMMEPWIGCECHKCMAPPGAVKKTDRSQIKGPPSTDYLAHRQDQSVLGLLAYRWLHEGGQVALNSDYFGAHPERRTT
eukprot:CAMPEP_0176010422 /NCGR_PEP_ID=MMETSP0120_2-20121206/4759_1 /TAXON_ID=160619 /ORGANISM="Kryptoperidinium foliaceum, Strain CCMP 1326" /LENGTH=307 /DNA_ID=CAMNT_0017343251 /DNA_START=123 /DNA_END=1042 /DNA_ORIENTATION=-